MSVHAMLVKGTKIRLSQTAHNSLADLTGTPAVVFDDIHCISTNGISLEAGDQEEIDTTTLCSGDYKEYLLGQKDAGSLSFEAHFKPTSPVFKLVKAAAVAGDQRIIEVEFPDGAKYTSLGRIKHLPFSAGGVNGVYSTTVNIRLSGEPKETLPTP